MMSEQHEGKTALAEALAAEGFKVFPVIENGKIPAVSAWQHRAVKDAVMDMFPLTGYKGNFGVFTGSYKKGALLVVDIDSKKDRNGFHSLAFLDGELPPTREVSTPSGGKHLYYFVDKPVKSGVNVLGSGIDIRSGGGYVVAPGSKLDAGAYKWANDTAIAEAPEWLVNSCEKEEKQLTKVASFFDTPLAIERAYAYLKVAEPAVQGQGGDELTYKTAAKVKDLGVSELTCLELLNDLWNPRCEPPWGWDQLATKVQNAYHYGRQNTGSRSLEADFEVLPEENETALAFEWVTDFDSAKIPQRPWVLHNWLMRGAVTTIVAPGGVGKSTMAILLALSVATGKDLLGHKAIVTGKAWIANNEDDNNEIKRRLFATMKYHGVTPEETAGRIAISGGSAEPLLLHKKTADGKMIETPHVKTVINTIKAHRMPVWIADPLVELHEGDENSNNDMRTVMSTYRRIAAETQCSVVLIHHTKKHPSAPGAAYAGSQDAGRGASAVVNLARINLTLFEMSKQDARDANVPDRLRNRYVRLDDAKANMSLKSFEPTWFFKETMQLENGDYVGTLRPDLSLTRTGKFESELTETDLLQQLFWENDATEMPLATACDLLAKSKWAGLTSGRSVRRKIEEIIENMDISSEGAFFTKEESPDRKGYWTLKVWETAPS